MLLVCQRKSLTDVPKSLFVVANVSSERFDRLFSFLFRPSFHYVLPARRLCFALSLRRLR